MKKFGLLMGAVIFFVLGGSAQTNYWEASLNTSLMTPNNFNMMEYSAWTVGSEVTWWSRVEKDEWWVQRRRNPAFGVRASFAAIPKGIAGHRIGVVGLVKAPLVDRLDYHIGLGLSSFTKSQYFTHDSENIFISTLVNCLIDVGFDWSFSDCLSVSAALLHSSNGMLNRPNKGLNFLQAGVSLSLGKTPVIERHLIEKPTDFKRHEVGFTLQGGAVVSRDTLTLPDNAYYPCYDLSLNYQYYLDPVVAVGGTLDLWCNGTHYKLSRRYRESYKFPCYVSALGFVEGFWGPLSIKAGVGPVILAPPRVSIRFYERVGAYYNFGHNYVGVALNAHAGMIEFIEWSYGRRFPVGK